VITVERPAPLLTVQDRGRFGYLASGVTYSGPLDAVALDVANALVGNSPDAAALEGCLGGAQFHCDRDLTFAITGARVAVTCDSAVARTYVAHQARAGDTITIDHAMHGAVWYIAFRGGIDVPAVLGSRSTLLAAGLGGLGGGPLKPRAQLRILDETPRSPLARDVPDMLRSPLDDAPVPLAPATRSDALDRDEWDRFYRATYAVSHSVSRVGYRLEGDPLPCRLPADIPSEPACAGAMQLPPQGYPIVLMADFPTIGGYPVIGVVPSFALGQLAQRAPGSPVRFTAISIDEALAANRRLRQALSQWSNPG
jgi:biotin-dependent carboxylase-like uncharacterized protein